jgi:ribose transport system substrate-binding protein
VITDSKKTIGGTTLNSTYLGSLVFALSLALPAGAQPLTVGVAINDLTNPFFLQIVKGAKRKADELSQNQTTMLVADSDYDLQRQRQQLRQMVDRKAQIVVITAADQKKMQGDIEYAIAQGTRVIAVDVAADGAIATVATDNVKAGFMACEFLANKINGSGTLGLIDGPPVSAVFDRVKGCKDALAKYPGMTLVTAEVNGEGNQAGGGKAMQSLISKHSDIKAIFAINDPSAIGAELYAQQAGKRNLVISSVDGAPIMQQTLKNSGALVSATAAQYPDQMAEQAVSLGYALLQGGKASQKLVLIDPSLVTKDNVHSYKGWND